MKKMIHYPITINGLEVQADFYEEDVEGFFLPLLQKLSDLRRKKGKRVFAMLAAPPGAGKSTLLSFLESLSGEREDLSPIQIIGMDGFHRRQEYLTSHSLDVDGKEVRMVDIKGAPETFDLEKLTDAVRRIADGETIGFPVYDRLLHNPVEDALTVDGEIVLLEGNYLLLDREGWRDLSGYADLTVFLRADEGLLRERLIDRRIKTGVTEEKAATFVDFSDMRNVRTVLNESMKADLTLELKRDGSFYTSV